MSQRLGIFETFEKPGTFQTLCLMGKLRQQVHIFWTFWTFRTYIQHLGHLTHLDTLVQRKPFSRPSLVAQGHIQIAKDKQENVFKFWISKSFHLWISATNFPPGGSPDMRMQFTKTGDIAFPRAFLHSVVIT